MYRKRIIYILLVIFHRSLILGNQYKYALSPQQKKSAFASTFGWNFKETAEQQVETALPLSKVHCCMEYKRTNNKTRRNKRRNNIEIKQKIKKYKENGNGMHTLLHAYIQYVHCINSATFRFGAFAQLSSSPLATRLSFSLSFYVCHNLFAMLLMLFIICSSSN